VKTKKPSRTDILRMIFQREALLVRGRRSARQRRELRKELEDLYRQLGEVGE